VFEGRVAQFNAPGQPFEIRHVVLRSIGPGEVLVKVHRANICGSDLHAWHGSFATRGLGGHLPTVLGHEMVGSIAATGDGVGEDSDGVPLQPGTRVVFPYFFPCHRCRNCLIGRRVSCLKLTMAMLGDATKPPYFVGGYGDYFLLPAGAVLHKVPDTLSDEVVSGVNCALSQVIYGLDRARLSFGESVIVQGAGGLGLFATAVARARGAARVIVVDAVPERLDLAKAFGADEVISLVEHPDPTDRIRHARRLTDGLGADVIVEVVGDPAVVPEGLKMLAQSGRYLEMGNINMGRTYAADPSRLVTANKTMIGVSLYEPAALYQAMSFLAANQHRLPLDRLVTTSFPLEEINDAFAAADSRHVVRASIVM
jgi:threonine dehydrogenase-like Zn-dependent dehydrogenase